MLNRLAVMKKLNNMFGAKLEKIGFLPNKNLVNYKLNNSMGEFKFKFNLDRKDNLHLQFTYIHPILGERLLKIQEAIVETKGLWRSTSKRQVKYRPTIIITDWLELISENKVDVGFYDKWLIKLNCLEDVKLTKETYEIIFELIEKNIVNKITDEKALYEYFKNKELKNPEDLQNILILSDFIEELNIDEVYNEIKDMSSYKRMIEVFSVNIDLTFDLLKKGIV